MLLFSGTDSERGMDKLNQQLNRAGLVISDEEAEASNVYHLPWVHRYKNSKWIKYVPFFRYYEKSIFTSCRKDNKAQ